MGSVRLTTPLTRLGPGTAIVLDDEQVATIGEGAKRFPVRATINGYTWGSTVVRMRGQFVLGLSREVRDGAGVQAGDVVTAEITLDTSERSVEVPPALAEALERDPEAGTAFARLAYTHRKEFARWVSEAKREKTRERRVAQALEMLRAGRTRS